MGAKARIVTASSLLACIAASGIAVSYNANAQRFVVNQSSRAEIDEMQNSHDSGRATLIANAENGTRAKADIVERFNRALDELNQTMAPRPNRGLELNVTERLRPFFGDTAKVQDALDAFERLGLSPHRDKANERLYFTYAHVDYGRLVEGGREHFLPGDRLVFGYSSASPEGNAVITKFTASLLNDSFP
jgi:hypothetical protein